MTEKAHGVTVVFFDGYCGLCDRFVSFLLAKDVGRKLRFAPLQGKTAEAALDQSAREDLSTVVVMHRGKKLVRSEAALVALGELGGFWALLAGAGLVFPRFLRDAVYRLVATNRYRIFPKRATCRLPSPAERSAFLD